MKVELEYGSQSWPGELPDGTFVFQPGVTNIEPPPVDARQVTAKALARPLGTEPIRALVRRGSKVAIAFPDRVKGGTHDLAHRRVALRAVLEELAEAGVNDEDIRFVCAVGLHRKNSRDQMATYLPSDVLSPWDRRITNHDAEDPDGIVDMGTSDLGDVVAFNRTCAEADLTIVLGHVQGNPYGGFSGGYKTFTTGLTTWRSIAGHHTPATMHRHDFVPISTRSHFREQLRSIGRRIMEHICHPIFVIDAVLGRDAQVLGVYAGAVEEVERASWPLAELRTNVTLDVEPFDIAVFGLPADFHYGPGMGRNPILASQAIAATIVRIAGVLRPGAVAVVTANFGGFSNKEWFPSYPETFARWAEACSVAEMTEVVEDISTRETYIDAYRRGAGYHPFHGFSMLSMAEIGLQQTSQIFIVGPAIPGDVRMMGMRPVRSLEEGLKRAEAYLSGRRRIIALPGFLETIPPHLFAREVN